MQADEQALEQLTVMGFPHARSQAALIHTNNNMSAAVQWLFDNTLRSDSDLRLNSTPAPPALGTGHPAPAPVHQGALQGAAITSHPLRGASVTSPLASLDDANSPNEGHIFYGASPSQPGLYPSSSTTGLPGGPLQMSALSMNPLLARAFPGTAARPAERSGERIVGLGGIIRREQETAITQSSEVKQAFQDLEALMRKGQSMVQLAKDLRSKLGAQARSGPEGSEDDVSMDPAMEQDLIDLGIYSPVTRQSAGKRYEQDLARQLADFLRQPLQRAGGMLTLHEVFCLFNRARGTELVSPDDLKTAATLCAKLDLPIQLRIFPSGVAVVQDASFSDANICLKLVGLLRASDAQPSKLGKGLTATQTAAKLKLPIAVSMEQLLLAERQGFVCRDDGPEGLIFYRNFFQELPVRPLCA